MITSAITLPQAGATVVFIVLSVIGVAIQAGLSRRTTT
jgi:Na+-transporting methylmalonyl-CoA/oxaloacetate decarboxylase gamma subunit